MKINKEISAIFSLIDDPDEEVYSTVSDKIISLGKDIIPELESLWQKTQDENMQVRIESLIHKLHFKDLVSDLEKWHSEKGNLLTGAMLVSRYFHPETNTERSLQEIEKIRKNIWLELNNYLTPLEETSIVSSILFNYFKLKGTEIVYEIPDNFLITHTLENKTGNVLSNGIIYLALCELLNISIHAINIPNQFLLAYFDSPLDIFSPTENQIEKILFFIDPLNGQIYSLTDIKTYFKKMSVETKAEYFEKKNYSFVIQFLLKECAKCFENDFEKISEIKTLIELLNK